MSEGATDLRDNLKKLPLISTQLRELEAGHGQTGQWVVSVLARSHARSLDRRMRGVPAHTQIGDEPLSQSAISLILTLKFVLLLDREEKDRACRGG